MRKPERRQLQAIAALSAIEEFEHLTDWLHESIVHEQERVADISDETMLRWNQGRIQALRDALKTIETATETIRKLN